MRNSTLIVPLIASNAIATSLDVDNFIARVTEFFPADVPVSTDTPGLEDTWNTLATEFNLITEENGLASETCSDITVIFARGTTEIGNVGVLIGPFFFDAIRDMAGASISVAVQGVEYAANMTGYLAGGDQDGSQKMAEDITTALTVCPDTKIVISGYSQGAQLVHNAAGLLPAATMAKVSSAVTFGDPFFPAPPQGVSNKTMMSICHSGDAICGQGTYVGLPHLTYAANATEAAAFVMNNVGCFVAK